MENKALEIVKEDKDALDRVTYREYADGSFDRYTYNNSGELKLQENYLKEKSTLFTLKFEGGKLIENEKSHPDASISTTKTDYYLDGYKYKTTLVSTESGLYKLSYFVRGSTLSVKAPPASIIENKNRKDLFDKFEELDKKFKIYTGILEKLRIKWNIDSPLPDSLPLDDTKVELEPVDKRLDAISIETFDNFNYKEFASYLAENFKLSSIRKLIDVGFFESIFLKIKGFLSRRKKERAKYKLFKALLKHLKFESTNNDFLTKKIKSLESLESQNYPFDLLLQECFSVFGDLSKYKSLYECKSIDDRIINCSVPKQEKVFIKIPKDDVEKELEK